MTAPNVPGARCASRQLTPSGPTIASWTVPAGIDQLLADMGRHGLTKEDFEHTFVRLEQINRLTAAGLLDEHLHRTYDEDGRHRVMAANQ